MNICLNPLIIAVIGVLMVFSSTSGTLFADEIELNNGNVIEGDIVKETETEVIIKTEYGRMTIQRSQIRAIKRYRPYAPKAPEKKENPGEGTRDIESESKIFESARKNAEAFLKGLTRIEEKVLGEKYFGVYYRTRNLGWGSVEIERSSYKGTECYAISSIQYAKGKSKKEFWSKKKEIYTKDFQPLYIMWTTFDASRKGGEEKGIFKIEVNAKIKMKAMAGTRPAIEFELEPRLITEGFCLHLLVQALDATKKVEYSFNFLDYMHFRVIPVTIRVTGNKEKIRDLDGRMVLAYRMDLIAPLSKPTFHKRSFWISESGILLRETQRNIAYTCYGPVHNVQKDRQEDTPPPPGAAEIKATVIGMIKALYEKDEKALNALIDFLAIYERKRGRTPNKNELDKFRKDWIAKRSMSMTPSKFNDFIRKFEESLKVNKSKNLAEVMFFDNVFAKLKLAKGKWTIIYIIKNF